ncbi:MAG: AzlD domain-containing protein, partial [Acidimicrobiia bacterium]|nr:AzlD domain-containing protein [Acidimicrobiia bacterium]
DDHRRRQRRTRGPCRRAVVAVAVNGWLIIVAVGVGTYLARVSFIAGFGDRTLPQPVERALTYVAPAVFAAIVFPAVLLPEGTIDLSPGGNPRFLAAIFAAGAAWRLKSVVAVTVVGMSALWIIDYLT